MKEESELKQLTRAEEDVMHIIWHLGRTLVSDIISHMVTELEMPKPPHSTISSIVRILEQKGFVNHKAYGRTYEYFPIISKEQYSRRSIRKLLTDYFGGSTRQLVSFLVNEKDLDLKSLVELVNEIENEENSKS